MLDMYRNYDPVEPEGHTRQVMLDIYMVCYIYMVWMHCDRQPRYNEIDGEVTRRTILIIIVYILIIIFNCNINSCNF